MTRKRKIIWWVLCIFILAGAGALYLFFTKKPAPLQETATAREALSLAKTNKADIYASKSYKQAECFYDSAMNCWKRENIKPFYKSRDYSKVKNFAALAAKEAQEANAEAIKKENNFQVDLKGKTDKYRKLITDYDTTFKKTPMPKIIREENNKGQLLLKEAELAYINKDFVGCSQKISDAEVFLNRSYQYFTTHLQEYFTELPKWQQHAKATIDQSRRTKSNAIIIDKFARKCYLYQAGKLKHEFIVELGPNWIGNKTCRGDKRTPEGFYKITAIKNSKQTKFYKALLLNYPNTADLSRLRSNKKFSGLGNLIEIHGGGNGGKRGDWTDGCVALCDSDIDILFRYAYINMPVTIVGSLRPLNEILN